MAARSTVWKLCSEYNRRKAADSDGFTVCVSCGKSHHWKEMDAGHFVPRSRGKAVYWDPENIHAQCPGCNRFDEERAKINYTLWMIDTYGREFVEQLQAKSRTTFRERKADVEYWRVYYSDMLKKLAA